MVLVSDPLEVLVGNLTLSKLFVHIDFLLNKRTFPLQFPHLFLELLDFVVKQFVGSLALGSGGIHWASVV